MSTDLIPAPPHEPWSPESEADTRTAMRCLVAKDGRRLAQLVDEIHATKDRSRDAARDIAARLEEATAEADRLVAQAVEALEAIDPRSPSDADGGIVAALALLESARKVLAATDEDTERVRSVEADRAAEAARTPEPEPDWAARRRMAGLLRQAAAASSDQEASVLYGQAYAIDEAYLDEVECRPQRDGSLPWDGAAALIEQECDAAEAARQGGGAR